MLAINANGALIAAASNPVTGRPCMMERPFRDGRKAEGSQAIRSGLKARRQRPRSS